ncbi:hypothetical protein RBSH_05012 [Rhodopirellula baltica SH28]|uniref:Uncharacterized protein n=2 Tax=Rhodopirellula baltica TaxID=265606 RepID=K5CZI6_RHOBT|nr:hypothetical protein RBSH_05012 [Rhodopirellula baltica SH28]ELP30067.1 hypothetical protein RBSWK_06155 [Rhodopirellula baltica SWK14]
MSSSDPSYWIIARDPTANINRALSMASPNLGIAHCDAISLLVVCENLPRPIDPTRE